MPRKLTPSGIALSGMGFMALYSVLKEATKNRGKKNPVRPPSAPRTTPSGGPPIGYVGGPYRGPTAGPYQPERGWPTAPYQGWG